jgi:putative peptidoglycan lipid II flippase
MVVCLLASKVLGLGRDWLMLKVYGLSLTSDAYLAAFQLPQFAIILLGGLGGPFHTATVAVFSKWLSEDEATGEKRPTLRAKHLSAAISTLILATFGLLAWATWLWAEPILRLVLNEPHGASPLLVQATVQLKIMSPIIALGGLVGFLYGALNLLGVYLWPALSPAIMSLVMVVALLVGSPTDGGLLLAYSSLLGAVAQVALQIPQYWRKGFSLSPVLGVQQWQANKAQVKAWWLLLWPALLGTTIGQAMIYVDMAFANSLGEGGWSAVVYSNRLIQLPIGVLQTALLVPLFPKLVALAEETPTKGPQPIHHLLQSALGGLWFVSVPLMWLLLGFGEQTVRVVFQHGRFDAQDTALISLALSFQVLQMLPYFARDTLTRVFYAFGDTQTPLWVGVLAIGVKYLFNAVFVPLYGVGGITFSISLITLFNLGVLALLLRRKAPGVFPLRGLLSVGGKLLLASVPLLATMGGWLLWGGPAVRFAIFAIEGWAVSSTVSEGVTLALGLGVTLGVGLPLYVALCQRLGLVFVGDVMAKLRAKLQRKAV